MSNSYLFFKYRPINKYFIDSLARGHLYFSSREALNDPFDCNIDIKICIENAITLSGERDASFLKSILKDKKFLQVFQESMSTLGVCSFSRTIESHVMWSHYADNHKGVCVLYDFPEDYLNDEDKFIGIAMANYGENPVTSWIRDNFEKYKNDTERFGVNLSKEYLVSKGPGWSYEQESRIIKDSPGVFKIPKEYIRQICFGLKTPLGDIELIREITNSFAKQVSLCKVARSKDEYGIDIVGL